MIFLVNGSYVTATTTVEAACRYLCQRPWRVDRRSGRVAPNEGLLYAYALGEQTSEIFDLDGCVLDCGNLPQCLSDLVCPYRALPVSGGAGQQE